MIQQAQIVIVGAGIAGVSAAYQLAVKEHINSILLIDERPPLTLTSDHSTECYRNWWPGPGNTMVRLMNRSIDLMEALADETDNIFNLNRRGYLYLSADPGRIAEIEEQARQISLSGAGTLRIHRGQAEDPPYQPADPESYRGQPDGADLLLDHNLIARHFPYLSADVTAALHVRRAGWFSAQQLGMYLLQTARQHGVKFIQARVTGIEMANGGVESVRLDSGEKINCEGLVIAAGPMLKEVCRMLGVELPVTAELHQKAAFRDHLSIVDRDVPLLIWTDRQKLAWDDDEVEILSGDKNLSYLLDEMPAGVHTRPEGSAGSQVILMLWEYHTAEINPAWPLPLDPIYPEIVLRGLMRMLPGMQAYLGRTAKPQHDGGFYIKTRENRPLIGRLPIKGAHVFGALSGFGLMCACAGAELLAAHVLEKELPDYAPALAPERYENPEYRKLLDEWGATGQL